MLLNLNLDVWSYMNLTFVNDTIWLTTWRPVKYLFHANTLQKKRKQINTGRSLTDKLNIHPWCFDDLFPLSGDAFIDIDILLLELATCWTFNYVFII